MPATGGVTTQINSGSIAGNQVLNPAWTPDSKSILLTLAIAGTYYIANVDASGSGNFQTLTSPLDTDLDLLPTVSPDNSTFAFIRQTLSAAILFTSPMYEGASLTRIVGTNANNANPSYPRWTPFLGSQKFIGTPGTNVTAGTMANTSSGFLWGQNGTSFASFLSFQAHTAAQAAITPQTSGGGAALVFLLKADSITSLSYANGYYLPPVTIAPAVPQVLVSFDPTTGMVANTVPLIKQGLTPQVKGDLLTYRGQIPAVYDGKGKNLAPNGATEVTLNAKTGQLVSLH